MNARSTGRLNVRVIKLADNIALINALHQIISDKDQDEDPSLEALRRLEHPVYRLHSVRA